MDLPRNDPGYQRYRTSGSDTTNGRGSKGCVAAARSDGHQHNTVRKENRFDISDNSQYYSTDERNNLSRATKSKLISGSKRIEGK